MRRKGREMPEEFAWEVADKCEWAVLGMVDPSGMPYCVPVSIARDGKSVYFHSAKGGFKIECLENQAQVCISCVGDTFRTPDKFTTEFESAILRGQAVEVTDEQEKIHGLRLLCERHTPTNMENFDNAITRSLSRTGVWKVEVREITGKRKKYDAQGKEMKFGRME